MVTPRRDVAPPPWSHPDRDVKGRGSDREMGFTRLVTCVSRGTDGYEQLFDLMCTVHKGFWQVRCDLMP
jgi:hypothetical protein